MPIKTSIWKCEFCSKRRTSKKWIFDHEQHCYRNPLRAPMLGELTYTSQIGRYFNDGPQDYLPAGCDWVEFVLYDEMTEGDSAIPPWHPPDAGLIWDGFNWREVPGYRNVSAKPGHGCAGGAAGTDDWPLLDGIPLNKVRPLRNRLEIFREAQDGSVELALFVHSIANDGDDLPF